MIKQYTLILFLMLFAIQSNISAQRIELSDSSEISLLTNSPWDKEVYAVFGHTAIRVKDIPNRLDYVFNYGIFDFNSSNFIYRFTKGETDYIVAAQDFNNYITEYKERGVDIVEQILNLSQEEKQNIWDALCINSLPQNRMYRYNFFFDNCATRPRDIIEKNIKGEIKYSEAHQDQTFRDLVHECVNQFSWLKFGIDLVIGAEADRNATEREKMFLPLYLKNAYDGAEVINHSEKRPLVKQVVEYKASHSTVSSKSTLDPALIAGLIFLCVVVLVSFFSLKTSKQLFFRIFDFLMFLVYGLAGVVIAFMVFVSEHPCTDINWNLVWLQPLHLIAAFLLLVKYSSKYAYYYHFINFVVLGLFLVCWIFIPQQINTACIPFILALAVRSGTNVVRIKRDNKTKS